MILKAVHADRRQRERIRKIGGTVEQNTASPRQEVTSISLRGELITDEDIALLKIFDTLQKLTLFCPGVTDKGLVHLKRFANLHSLELCSPHITRRSLVHLQSLP